MAEGGGGGGRRLTASEKDARAEWRGVSSRKRACAAAVGLLRNRSVAGEAAIDPIQQPAIHRESRPGRRKCN